jgi:hypothetical protein
MADLGKEFCRFHDRIALTNDQKSILLAIRDAIRERIRGYFRYRLRVAPPDFRSQGLFAMDTIVNPVDNVYRIDDGVGLQHLDKQNSGSWPAVATVHQWISDAVGGHACEKPMDQRTCISILFAEKYRVNLYAYGKLNGQYLLATGGEAKWLDSDPPAFIIWFRSYVYQRGEQLRRMVRYLLAWADNQSMNHGRIADGMILTVLATQHFHGNRRDDLALARTMEAISNTVRSDFFILNPVKISEELTACLSTPQKIRLNDAIQAFADIANGAIAIENNYKASKLWRKQFGDRFPIATL